MFRLMILDNVECTYFACNAVYYEWGCGVSTKEGSEFQKAIKRDWDETTEYICEHCRNNYLEKKIKNYYLSGKILQWNFSTIKAVSKLSPRRAFCRHFIFSI